MDNQEEPVDVENIREKPVDLVELEEQEEAKCDDPEEEFLPVARVEPDVRFGFNSSSLNKL